MLEYIKHQKINREVTLRSEKKQTMKRKKKKTSTKQSSQIDTPEPKYKK